jgi:hypothetical protein
MRTRYEVNIRSVLRGIKTRGRNARGAPALDKGRRDAIAAASKPKLKPKLKPTSPNMMNDLDTDDLRFVTVSGSKLPVPESLSPQAIPQNNQSFFPPCPCHEPR